MTLSNAAFTKEFNVNKRNWFDMLIKIIKIEDIDNSEMLSIAGNVVKYVEQIPLQFKFSDTFKVENIPDKDIINLLDNIENRLQSISGSACVIVRRISDNKIMKYTVTSNN